MSNAKAKGDIEIEETDTSGKFIKIVNKSDKDQSLSEWQLKHSAGSEETVCKVYKSVNIKGGQSVLIYSSNIKGVDHSPPDVLVTKGQKWLIANEMTSTLCKRDEVVPCSCQWLTGSTLPTTPGTKRDEVVVFLVLPVVERFHSAGYLAQSAHPSAHGTHRYHPVGYPAGVHQSILSTSRYHPAGYPASAHQSTLSTSRYHPAGYPAPSAHSSAHSTHRYHPVSCPTNTRRKCTNKPAGPTLLAGKQKHLANQQAPPC